MGWGRGSGEGEGVGGGVGRGGEHGFGRQVVPKEGGLRRERRLVEVSGQEEHGMGDGMERRHRQQQLMLPPPEPGDSWKGDGGPDKF